MKNICIEGDKDNCPFWLLLLSEKQIQNLKERQKLAYARKYGNYVYRKGGIFMI